MPGTGRLWAAHIHPDTSGSPRRTEVRWYEIDAETPALVQSGDVADPDLCLFYPVIHPDTAGGAALVMGAVGPSTFASVFYAERLSVDAPGVVLPGEGEREAGGRLRRCRRLRRQRRGDRAPHRHRLRPPARQRAVEPLTAVRTRRTRRR